MIEKDCKFTLSRPEGSAAGVETDQQGVLVESATFLQY